MMRKRNLLGIGAALCIAGISTASATDLSYQYAELRYVDTEIGNADGDGFKSAGSYPLQNTWLLVGGFTALDFDFGVETSALEIGAGYVHRYSDKLDFVGDARLIRAEVDTASGDEDENGISVAGGVRGRFNQQFEGRASLKHVNLDNSDTFIEVGADYYFNPQIAAGATLEFAGDADTLTIGVRWFFGE